MGATGTAILDFGAFPGTASTRLDVAMAGLLSTSWLEGWIRLEATADHSLDEHRIEEFDVHAEFLSAGNARLHLTPRHGRCYGLYNTNWAWV